jgi:hypothetical protein
MAEVRPTLQQSGQQQLPTISKLVSSHTISSPMIIGPIAPPLINSTKITHPVQPFKANVDPIITESKPSADFSSSKPTFVSSLVPYEDDDDESTTSQSPKGDEKRLSPPVTNSNNTKVASSIEENRPPIRIKFNLRQCVGDNNSNLIRRPLIMGDDEDEYLPKTNEDVSVDDDDAVRRHREKKKKRKEKRKERKRKRRERKENGGEDEDSDGELHRKRTRQ